MWERDTYEFVGMANVLSWRVGGWRGCKGRQGNGFIFYVKGKDEDAGRGS